VILEHQTETVRRKKFSYVKLFSRFVFKTKGEQQQQQQQQQQRNCI